MRKFHLLTAAAFSIALTSCSSESPEPTEQIIIRELGQAAPVVKASDENAPGASDLLEIGKTAFTGSCAACHSVEADGLSAVGPNLNGIVGRAAGAIEGFEYSEALAQSGITWTAGDLDQFIANPAAKVSGTTMAAGAISNAERRAAIVAYLSSLSQ